MRLNLNDEFKSWPTKWIFLKPGNSNIKYFKYVYFKNFLPHPVVCFDRLEKEKEIDFYARTTTIFL